MFRSPGSLFCFPFCIGKPAAGCSIPLYQNALYFNGAKTKKGGHPSNERQRSAF
jgi:hypothetical protein